MRREELPLINIVEHADLVSEMLTDADKDSFVDDTVLHSAVTYQLAVIGEAVHRLPRELWEQHPSVPWREAVDFRNFVIHGYDVVTWERVWDAATQDGPRLRQQVWDILERHYPQAAAALRQRGH